MLFRSAPLALKGEQKLCQNVNGLNQLFIELDKQNYHYEKTRQEINVYIHNHNVNGLMNDCSHNGFVGTTFLEIRNNILEIKPEKLNAAFQQTFKQLIGELEKKENAGEHVKEFSRKTAYQLLGIGNRMGDVFKSNEKEKMEMAFQLFAAQLAVYSLRLDSLPISAPHKKIAIHAIAQSWPIGMKTETEKSAAGGGEPSGMA
jgi:hypothetical protein